MSGPTKILPFRKAVETVRAKSAELAGAEFPRLRREQGRSYIGNPPAVAGFGIPPLGAK